MRADQQVLYHEHIEWPSISNEITRFTRFLNQRDVSLGVDAQSSDQAQSRLSAERVL